MLQDDHEEHASARKRLPRLNHTGSGHIDNHNSDIGGSFTENSSGMSNGSAVTSPTTMGSNTMLSPQSRTVEHGKNVLHAPGEAGLEKKLTFAVSKGQLDDKSGGNTKSDHEDDSNDEYEKLPKREQLLRWIHRLRQTFGMSFLMLVSAVYAVQGFNSFSKLAVNYFFKDDLKLQPAESQTLMTLMMFPWGIKPLYGIISDSLPLFGYHRKSYMILCSTIGALASLTLSIPDGITTPFGAVLVLMLGSLSSAVIDVVIDAKVVEMSRLDPKYGANDLQSVSWISMSIGGVFGSILSGPATDGLGVRGVFFFASVGPLVILGFSMFMKESRSTISSRKFVSSARRQFRQLKGAITTPVIWKCALWVFLSGAVSPGYSQVTFYFATDVLKFTPEFLGTVSAFGFVFLLVGTLIYNSFFKDVSFRRIFLFAQLSLALVSMLDVILVTRANLDMGIPDKAFVLGDAVIADVISRLKTMPVLVLCAKLCPKGVEGTLFALLMSISNFSYSVSEFWGAIICAWLGIAKDHYDQLWLAIVLRSLLKVMPIFFLFLIPATDPQQVVDKLNFGGDDRDDSTIDEDEDANSQHELVGTIRQSHIVRGSPVDPPTPGSPEIVV